MKRASAPGVPGLTAAVAAVTFAAATANGYVYDDVPIVAQQPLLHSLGNVPRLLASPWWVADRRLYRPLSQLSLCVDWAVAGGAPWLAHLENVALHAVVAFLVARLALRWLPTAGALAAGLLFAVAPAHVEAVSTVVGRAELLSALFLVLAMLACTGERAPTAARRLGVAALAALAIASKEVGVIAPAVVLAAAWASRAQRRYAWQWTAAAAVGVIPLLLARVIVLGTVTGDLPHPAFRLTGVMGREAIALATLPRTVAHLALPLTPPVDVAPTLAQVRSPDPALILLGVALIIAAAALLVRHFRRPSPFTLGVWITAAGIAPTANLLFASGVVLAGRGLYAPSIGAALCVGAAVSCVWSLSDDVRVRRVTMAALAAWLVAAAAVSVRRVGMWRDRARFVSALVALEPDSYRSHLFAAALHTDEGRPDLALGAYRTGVALFPADPMFLTDAARAAVAAGDTTAAIQWLRAAVLASPEHSFLARTRLVLLLVARRDSAAALRVVNDGLAVLPDQRIWREFQTRLTPAPRR